MMEEFIAEQQDLDPKIARLVSEHFWELVAADQPAQETVDNSVNK